MNIYSLLAVYFVVWWLCFFAVLPWGVRTQAEADDVVPGSVASAPVAPNLWKKALATSILAAILVAAGIWFIQSGIVSLDDLPGPSAPSRL